MVSPLKAFETDYAELHAFLLENNQLSMANFLENHSRKIYLLSCASYYENQITRILEQFIRSHTDDELRGQPKVPHLFQLGSDQQHRQLFGFVWLRF